MAACMSNCLQYHFTFQKINIHKAVYKVLFVDEGAMVTAVLLLAWIEKNRFTERI